MKNTKLLATLTELGLSENEAKVYLASLALGPNTVLKIASAAEIKRTTVYSVIQSLKQQGLMRIELKGFKELFVAEDPERLKLVLNTRREKFETLLPEFSALYNLKGGEGLVKYYEGLEAIKGVYEQFLEEMRPSEFYLAISDMKKFLELDEVYFKDYFERRAKLNIKVRSLLQDSEQARYYQRFGLNFLQNIKILPKETKLSANLVITPRQIFVIQLVPPIMGIMIENQSVITLQKEMFEMIWSGLPANENKE
jgi:sugar-specific transcriptional regulator TrmB